MWAPHPWQNRSPVIMRVPHVGQKFEARSGAGTGAGACRPEMKSLCLSASSSMAVTRQVRASQPDAVCRKLWRTTHAPELSTATVSLHGGRLEADARYTIVNTAEAIIALVEVGAVLNLIFMNQNVRSGPRRAAEAGRPTARSACGPAGPHHGEGTTGSMPACIA